MINARLALLTVLVASLPVTAIAQTVVRPGGGGKPLKHRVTVASRSAHGAKVVLGEGAGSIRCDHNAVGFTLRPHGAGETFVRGRLQRFTLARCSDSLSRIGITACRLARPLPIVSALAVGPAGGTIALGRTYLRCDVAHNDRNCYFSSSSLIAAFANSGAQFALGAGLLTRAAPPHATDDLGHLCGPRDGAVLSVRFTDLVVNGRPRATLSLTP
jgi:hypothetical protein